MPTTTTRPTRAPNLRERFDVLASSGFRCDYCGRSKKEGARLSVDHVVARAAGGTHDRMNLVTACIDCNVGKSDRPVPYPRWTVTTAWDRCLCSPPPGLRADPDQPVLRCTGCGFVAYQREFPVTREPGR